MEHKLGAQVTEAAFSFQLSGVKPYYSIQNSNRINEAVSKDSNESY